jgi:ribonucleoside-diphosphate reductase alpha chain
MATIRARRLSRLGGARAEKGPFPLFDAKPYLAGETHPEPRRGRAQAAIAEHGIRNALLTSIAPTGTISLFADNVSSGLEPVFSFTYTRHVLMPDGSAPRGGGERLRLPPLPPLEGTTAAPLPTPSSMPRRWSRATTW